MACAMAPSWVWRGKERKIQCRAVAQEQQKKEEKNPKLVTFIGKGGTGKTTCSVLAAQFYASIGLRTCLVIQSQDVTADFLLGHQLKHQPTKILENGSLTALRLETTKILAQPLEQVKKADGRISFSQGALQTEVAGEELSVLPGMDSIMALFVLDQLCGFARRFFPKRSKVFKPEYDVVVYDGPNSDETLRMFGCAERLRWYMNRFRSIAEKTDIGRVVLPSILRLAEASLLEDLSTERSTSELWELANTVLHGVEQNFANPNTFSSYIVTDPRSKLTEKTALRYWGCAVQAGVHVAGVVHHQNSRAQTWKEGFSSLPVASIPELTFGESPPSWEQILSSLDKQTCEVLRGDGSSVSTPPVSLDHSSGTVTCFLPGFDKADVKLSQLKRSELLLDAGDQKRVIKLPPQMHGKVKGAKFQDKSLIIQMTA
ncbi:uncharacterized protein At1g26090, chloroplastic [Selaginella moellendorffii]|nr:uncharacterized protein At1g26090, chloroplastic [Selaginella moellendorffii]|eukprot:XP_002967033.2 uncharacterized protein At1g26090, chloroplastic [Selaginella moellendorffii]